MKKLNTVSRIFNIILFLILILLVFYFHNNSEKSNNTSLTNKSLNQLTNLTDKDKVKLIKVIDGDTIEVEKLENNYKIFKVRLIGIDTPESYKNRKLQRDIKKEQRTEEEIINMGLKSKEFTKKTLSQSKYLYLEYDVQKYDKYGRTLAYVYLDNGQMLNYILVREGYAKVYTIPPNVKYQEILLEAQKLARQEKKGLWKGSD